MKIAPSQKIKIGIFTLIGLLILVGGIFLIGKRQNMFGSTFNIYGTFKNVGGLQTGNNIRFAGINVGTVQGIEIINDTTVRVDMIMQTKVAPFLKTDAIASIGSDGLMGDKLVVITPGTIGAERIKEGEKVLTANPLDYDKIIAKLTRVVDNADVITSSLSAMVTHISSGKGSIGRLLYSDTLAKNLEGTVRTAGQTMQVIKQSSEGFKENMTAVKHNFLLRGYFKKKDREKAAKDAAQQQGGTDSKTEPGKENTDDKKKDKQK